jgi:uncharacterized protein (TIGR02284 family)
MPPTAPSRFPSTASYPSLDASESAAVDTLNGLIETCADGAYGFASCADYSNISRHRTLFRQRAQQCEEAGAQLHAMVERLGGTPTRGGSASGALHRGWVAVRGTLSGLRDASILAECERGETTALERYQRALELTLAAEVRALVQRHMEGLRTNLGQIRILRETERGAA